MPKSPYYTQLLGVSEFCTGSRGSTRNATCRAEPTLGFSHRGQDDDSLHKLPRTSTPQKAPIDEVPGIGPGHPQRPALRRNSYGLLLLGEIYEWGCWTNVVLGMTWVQLGQFGLRVNQNESHMGSGSVWNPNLLGTKTTAPKIKNSPGLWPTAC